MKEQVEAVKMKLREAGLAFAEQGKLVLRFNTKEGIVMLFPATRKWQHHGRMHYGDLEAFIDWVNKRKPQPALNTPQGDKSSRSMWS